MMHQKLAEMVHDLGSIYTSNLQADLVSQLGQFIVHWLHVRATLSWLTRSFHKRLALKRPRPFD